MKKQVTAKPVERLFPFVMRSRNLLVGRDTLRRSKSRLHFVLITHDISEQSRAEVLSDFAHYPVVQHYTSAELEQLALRSRVWHNPFTPSSSSIGSTNR